MSLLRKFDSLNGAKYITINGYKSKTGEVANHNINVNVNIHNAKVKDLETLKKYPVAELLAIADKAGADFDTAMQAVSELIVSKERNLTENDRTAQSKAQTDSYVQLGKGLKLHKDSMNIYVSGFANSKTIIVEGEHKSVNSKPKTLVKKAIEKTLKMSKFRNFNVGNADSLTITGDTIQI